MKFSKIIETIKTFRLTSKEFLLTYPSDFLGQLSVGIITEHIQTQWRYENNHSKCKFDSAVCHSHGDKDIDHDHFHVYMLYKEKRLDISRNDLFSIKLDRPVYAFYYQENSDKVGKYEFVDSLNLVFDNLDETKDLTEEKRLEFFCKQINAEGGWKKIEYARPNIQPRRNYGSSFDMLNYVVDQAISLRSNFDIDDRLKKYKIQKEKDLKKKEKQTKHCKQQELEMNFCSWLRERILTSSLTKEEIKKEILENKDYSFLFLSKHLNYKTVLDSFFKVKPIPKPNPYWGIYYIPKKLENYLNYLDNWVKLWYTNPKSLPKNKRPQSLFISGDGDSGKTSLFRCLGDCCYWCNTWNMDAYESKPPFNLMDDYDGSFDYKGNKLDNNFSLLKPWFAGQPVITIGGKYKKPDTVTNGRPLIFISNYPYEERFPLTNDRKYLKDINCVIIDIPNGCSFKEYPKTTNIEILSMNWVKYDTRNTWWYQNKVLPKLDQQLIDNQLEIETIDLTDNCRLLDKIDEDLHQFGRPSKRRRYSI